MKIVVDRVAMFGKLSDREFEIFCSIACGDAPQHTADRLGISVKTVSTYRARVMEKLGLNSNQEIAVMAFKHGITKVEENEDGLRTEGSSDGRGRQDLGEQESPTGPDEAGGLVADLREAEGGDVLPTTL